MKTPIWEATTGALMALLFPEVKTLDSRRFAYFDLYTISCASGPVLRYTTCDRDVGYGGTVWSGRTVRIEPAGQRTALFHAKVGLDVDTWQASIYPRPVDDITGAAYPDKIGSTPWLAAAAAGALDGATATIDRAYFSMPLPAPQVAALTPVGVLRLFAGLVGNVDLGRSGVSLSINSHLELLNVQMPRNLYQAPCPHTLFDAGCGLSAASFAVSTACATGSTRYVLVSSATPPGGSSGTFTLGRVTFSSGLNSGFSRSIRLWDGATMSLTTPLPFDVAVADTFTVYPGCDKQLGTCVLFSNRLNFGGQPFIPAPETAA
jgi:Uncharacterized conserved protein (DUF2163)/Phage conserved hypothetical protein BR0599